MSAHVCSRRSTISSDSVFAIGRRHRTEKAGSHSVGAVLRPVSGREGEGLTLGSVAPTQNFSPSAFVVNWTNGRIVRHAAAKSLMNAGAQTCPSLNATDARNLPLDVLDERVLRVVSSGGRVRLSPSSPNPGGPSPTVPAAGRLPCGFWSGRGCRGATRPPPQSSSQAQGAGRTPGHARPCRCYARNGFRRAS